MLSDGRVVLRDPGNGRFNVYAPDGTPVATWPGQGNLSTTEKLYRDHGDNLWTLVLIDAGASVFDWVLGLAQYRPDGTRGDTLVQPSTDYAPPTVSGQWEDKAAVNYVPFSPVLL